jgi:class 3 adenylate cyclase
MAQLRTTILMKTDIAESTPRFRALFASDLQTVLSAHRAMMAHLAAAEGGRIVKSAGDGFWLEFPSATSAAKSAVAMQEALQSVPLTRGRNQLSVRIVIGLGDTAIQDGELIGDVLALITRLEEITPANEIYLTAAACLALTHSEIRTALVDNFTVKGFGEVSVYRVAQRHRTLVLPDAWILLSDLLGFGHITEVETISSIERVLDAVDLLIDATAREFGGTIRSTFGDRHFLTFPDATRTISAAERISQRWTEFGRGQKFRCPINICLHRGTIHIFRSFLYGEAFNVTAEVLEASRKLLEGEGNIFVTSPVQEALDGSPWRGRFDLISARISELKVFRLKSGE